MAMNELNIDSGTLRIALEMQLEDLSIMFSSNKGKQRQGEIRDFEVALASYKVELESQLLMLNDKNMCQSIATAVRLDADIINDFVAQEEQASFDRDLALKSTDGSFPVDHAASPVTKKIGLDEGLLDKLEELYVSAPEFEEDPLRQAESSSWAAGQKQLQMTYRSCTACTEEFPAHKIAFGVGCRHEYCRACLRRLFSDSLTDESLFPPRCCGVAIDVEQVLDFLPAKLVGQFRAKKVELETPNKTYCHQPTCSLFIPPAAISGDVGTCVRCRQRTCIICKGPSHHESDCPGDAGIQMLLDVAAENGWQRCYQCHRIVELNFGCYHISKSARPNSKHLYFVLKISIACRCKAEFCYLCGRRWKECACKQWDDDRLIARAQGIVDRGVGARRLDQVQRAALVERERENLLHNHECTHGNWSYRAGGHRCEECLQRLPQYIFECRQCHIMVCRRCRYNRI